MKLKQKSSITITKEPEYDAIMQRIDLLMNKGSENVLQEELLEIRNLALAAQAYEQKTIVIAQPTTFAGILEMKMYEMKLRQKDLAQKLHVSESKLSMIMSGKQKPDVNFLKSVHLEMNIDANILLEAV